MESPSGVKLGKIINTYDLLLFALPKVSWTKQIGKRNHTIRDEESPNSFPKNNWIFNSDFRNASQYYADRHCYAREQSTLKKNKIQPIISSLLKIGAERSRETART